MFYRLHTFYGLNKYDFLVYVGACQIISVQRNSSLSHRTRTSTLSEDKSQRKEWETRVLCGAHASFTLPEIPVFNPGGTIQKINVIR